MNNIRKIGIIAGILILVGGIGSLLTFKLLDKPMLVSEERIIEENTISEIDINMINADVNLIPTTDSSMKIRLTGTARKENNLLVDRIDNKVSINLDYNKGKKLFNFGIYEPKFQLMVYVPEKMYDLIKVEVGNGGIQATQIQSKQLVANTENGIIEMGNITATEFDVYSENGKLVLWDIDSDINGETESGEISLKQEDLNHSVHLLSENGTIEIQTSSKPTNVTFDADTENGRIDIFGDDTNSLIIGNGDHLIQLKTENGSVLVSEGK